MTTRVLRHETPVDGAWHTLELGGKIIHVATRALDKVEVWTLDIGGLLTERDFSVFGTGWAVPEHLIHVGTAVVPGGELVWHLFEDRGGA